MGWQCYDSGKAEGWHSSSVTAGWQQDFNRQAHPEHCTQQENNTGINNVPLFFSVQV